MWIGVDDGDDDDDAGPHHYSGLPEPDATDQKGNQYYKCMRVRRKFLSQEKDLMQLTFKLPNGESLKSLGIDIGLGDFVRIKPCSQEHKDRVRNPEGGRAYSPVSRPDVIGSFSTIVKAYRPKLGEKGGVSYFLKEVPEVVDVLISLNVEHAYWEERNHGYYCNKRSIEPQSKSSYHVCLISFGIGITEIAPVAISELADERVQNVTVLWANKTWNDVEWVWPGAEAEETDNLVQEFFAKQGEWGTRLNIEHILSQDTFHEASFRGRIDSDVLKKVFFEESDAQSIEEFVAVGTADMTKSAYDMLTRLVDIWMEDTGEFKGHWCGNSLLYQKCPRNTVCGDRVPSPLLALTTQDMGKRHRAPDEEHARKRPRANMPEVPAAIDA